MDRDVPDYAFLGGSRIASPGDGTGQAVDRRNRGHAGPLTVEGRDAVNVFVAVVAIVVVLGLAFFFVLTVTEVGQAVRQRHGKRPIDPAPNTSPNPAPQALDAAAQELRMRYARGEISREEYLQRKIDLEEF